MIPDFVTSHSFGLLDYNVGNSSLQNEAIPLPFDKRKESQVGIYYVGEKVTISENCCPKIFVPYCTSYSIKVHVS